MPQFSAAPRAPPWLPSPPLAGEGAEWRNGGKPRCATLFYAREIPIILGDHVSAEEGTGAVHTAPGHGVEDFAVGQKYGLVDKYTPAELNPLGPNGVYLPGTPIVGGQFIWKANEAIIELLRERASCSLRKRSRTAIRIAGAIRTPVVFRATPQWFIGMETAGLRAGALKAIHDDVTWYPGWGEERIAGMIEGRPDWCISRQRTWGVRSHCSRTISRVNRIRAASN
jgi:isoleucyl-tRNA synthetase